MAQVLEEEQKQQGGTPAPPVQDTIPVTSIAGDVSASDIMDQLNYLLSNTVRSNLTSSGRDMFHSEFYTTPAHAQGERNQKMSAFVVEGDGVKTMPLITLRQKTIALKEKLSKWWTFADVVPTWNENVNNVFRGEVTHEQNKRYASIICTQGNRCILGESWGGSGWGGCDDCNWLGNQGLHSFMTSDNHGSYMINPSAEKAFRNYQMKFEYHWNKYHNDVGNTFHKTPNV